MKATLTLCSLLVFSMAHSQVISTVQDGGFTDPTTWSCSCVPSSSDALVIDHDVTFSAALTLSNPSVTVTELGSLVGTGTFSFTNLSNFNIEGHVHSMGAVTVVGPTRISGRFSMQTHLDLSANLAMEGGELHVGGGLFIFSNSIISGTGSICFNHGNNSGVVSGNVDMCDFTPPASGPPYMNGNVAGTVTWCAMGQCIGVGIDEAHLQDLRILSISAEEVILTGSMPLMGEWSIHDASGKQVDQGGLRTAGEGTAMRIPIASLNPGLYVLQVRGQGSQRGSGFRFVKE